jgi:hypothetical protein
MYILRKILGSIKSVTRDAGPGPKIWDGGKSAKAFLAKIFQRIIISERKK